MKLLYYKTMTAFRGLPANFEVDFRRPSRQDAVEPICLVGLNGSGKSNVMQALAQVFYYLSCLNHPMASTFPAFAQDQRFIIRFELVVTPTNVNVLHGEDHSFLHRVRQVQIKREDAEKLPLIEYKYGPADFGEWRVMDSIQAIDNMLPRYVIGYSSGQNELISNPFVQMDFLYYQNMREALKGNQLMAVNRMFFMDYHINAMALIINYLNKSAGEPEDFPVSKVTDLPRGSVSLLNKAIGIGDVNSFSITMNLKIKIERSIEELEPLIRKAQTAGSATLDLDFFRRFVELPSDLLLTVQKLIKICTTINEVVDDSADRRRIKLVMFFRVDNEMRRAFQAIFRGTFKEVFQSLYLLNLLNINLYSDSMQEKVLNSRYKISINGFLPKYSTEEKVFHIDDIKLSKNGTEIDYKNLSDGEHQFMHIAGTLMLMDEPNTLFLLDEPETHLNPEWRSQFISTLNNVAKDKKDADRQYDNNMEIVMTTHSPFVLSDCRRESIFIFKRNATGYVEYSRPEINTLGASAQLLLQEIFNINSTISKMTEEKITDLSKKDMDSREKIQSIKDTAAGFGDSVEKFLLLVQLQKNAEKLEKK